MKSKTLLMFFLAMAMSSDELIENNHVKQDSQESKKCLMCGKKHNHHNSFCSPECCKQFRQKKKALLKHQ